jgi:hypothetical protein
MLTLQSTNLLDGLPCITTIQTTQNFQDSTMFDDLQRNILYEHRLHGVLVDAVTVIVRSADLNDVTDNDLLRSLIDHFDTQARKVRMPDREDRSEFG